MLDLCLRVLGMSAAILRDRPGRAQPEVEYRSRECCSECLDQFHSLGALGVTRAHVLTIVALSTQPIIPDVCPSHFRIPVHDLVPGISYRLRIEVCSCELCTAGSLTQHDSLRVRESYRRIWETRAYA